MDKAVMIKVTPGKAHPLWRGMYILELGTD